MGQVVSHLHADNSEEQLGSNTAHTTQASSMGKYSLKISGYKNPMGVVAMGGTPSLIGEFVGKNPQGSRTYTNPLTWESVPEGHNLIMGSGGGDQRPAKSQANGIVTH